MNREKLRKSGLLEQYVLGLTSRKESLLVEKILEEDPEAKKDFEKLRAELDGYVVDQGLQVPDDGRSLRRQEDFDDLDYEVIMKMTARNHTLVKWRYGLGALCLFLLCLCGFLFRLNENNHSDLVVEKAEHAQDQTSHHLELEHALENTPEWRDVVTRKAAAGNGVVLLHYLKSQHVAFLDLSHCDTISARDSYYVFFDGQLSEEPVLVISGSDRLGLHPVFLKGETSSVQVFSGQTGQVPSTEGGKKAPMADISLR
ncbi:MAG: hypothetical protein ACI81P_000463 [Neolewinella sp.]|jgi:hypothetical protein